jgi:hypothetical protein
MSDCRSAFVTTTSTAPSACAGVVHVISVDVTAVTTAATPPNVTEAPAWKSVPPIVTAVAAGPESGSIEMIDGGGPTVAAYCTTSSGRCPTVPSDDTKCFAVRVKPSVPLMLKPWWRAGSLWKSRIGCVTSTSLYWPNGPLEPTTVPRFAPTEWA